MREPTSPHTSPRRVGMYERLGRGGASSGKTIGIAVVALVVIILIAIVIALAG
jgi:hypothetical protein